MGIHVTDLVTQHRRDLGIVLGELQDPVIDADVTARQSERIDLVAVEDHDLPFIEGDRGAAGRDDARRDLLHPLLGLRILQFRRLRLDLPERLRTHLRLFRGRYGRRGQLVVGSAAGQRDDTARAGQTHEATSGEGAAAAAIRRHGQAFPSNDRSRFAIPACHGSSGKRFIGGADRAHGRAQPASSSAYQRSPPMRPVET